MLCTALNMLYIPEFIPWVYYRGRKGSVLSTIYMLNYSKHCVAQFVLTKLRNKMIKLVFPGM